MERGRGRGNASRRLAMPSLLWQEAERFHPRPRCCSSSVVEHSLGKGEVESSILSCSTINSFELSTVLFFKSRLAATHMDQKISSRLSATALVKLRAIAELSQ
jgi:hypothetical protein